MFLKSKAGKLRLDNHCSREAFREVPQSASYIFSPRSQPACEWTSFSHIMVLIWRYRPSTSSYRLMERQRCCLKMLEGDFYWQPRELGHRPGPHIKEQRIRRHSGERSSAVVITHLHIRTLQTNARLNHQLYKFDRALSWVWLLASVRLEGNSSFLVKIWSIVSCRSKEIWGLWSKPDNSQIIGLRNTIHLTVQLSR